MTNRSVEPSKGAVGMSTSSWSQLEIERVRDKSSPVRSRSTSQMKLLHPRVDDWCHTIVSTYGGGLVGGDSPGLNLRCGDKCRLYLTAPSFTQVFEGCAELRLEAQVGDDATVLYHGLPLVPHAASGLRQSSRWQLSPSSRLVVIDWLVSGRSANGESYLYETIDLELRVEREGKPILIDRIRSTPETQGTQLPSLFGGYEASLVVTFIGPQLPAVAEALAGAWNTPLGPGRAATAPRRLVNVNPLPNGHGHQLRAVATERRFLEDVERSVFAHLQSAALLKFDPLSRRA